MASSSKSLKRSREETDIVIKTAEGEPLPAESSLLRTFSSCAKQLPADTAEWDVSGFLYNNGQPFSHATVACWLSCASSALHGPAELDADDKAQLSTAMGLHAVLAFAHAVGSPSALCTAACSQLQSLQLVVQLPEQAVEVKVAKGAHIFEGTNDLELCLEELRSTIGQPLASQQQKKEFKRQLAEQIGALLHMAHVLRLQPLVGVLHDYIFNNDKYANSVLYGVLELVFPAATTALGSSTLSKEAYINSVMTRPCSLLENRVGHEALLKPISKVTFDADTQALEFKAELLQDIGCKKAHEQVAVDLQLFGPNTGWLSLRYDNRQLHLPAQLLLGRACTSTSNFDAIFKRELEQP